MGIYIKGMEMPDHCMECELAIEDNDYDKHCPFTKVECSNIARQVNCPLTEVPEPHGRLIDADKLLGECRPRGIADDVWKASNEYKQIINAPTVIESEVEDRKRGRGMMVFVHENDYFEKTPIEKQRVCCNCRNRKVSETVSKCMIDGHYIGYVQCFTNWCLHWATDELQWKGGDTE